MKMAAAALEKELAAFTSENGFRGKGPISVALVVTLHARNMELPLDDEKLITEGGGQVLGLGKGAVETVLKRHGIDRVLASEGGRTSSRPISGCFTISTIFWRTWEPWCRCPKKSPRARRWRGWIAS